MHKTTKKYLSLFLTLLLFLSLFPIELNSNVVNATSIDQDQLTNSYLNEINYLEENNNLEEAVTAVNNKGMTVPVFGTDSNINDVMQAYLTGLGYTGITVSIADLADIEGSSFSQYAKVNLDGRLEYFYVNPTENVSAANMGLTNYKVKFTLSDGNQTQKTEAKTIQLKWDRDKVKTFFDETLNNFNFSENITPNTDLNQIIQNFNLPAYTDGKDFKISWASDNAAASVGSLKSEYQNGQFLDYYPISIKQSSEAQIVNLTATFKYNRGNENIDFTHVYQITVPGIDLSVIKAEMQQDLDNYFTVDVLKYSYPNAGISFDNQNVLYDVQLPSSANIRKDTIVDGKVVSTGIKDLYQKYITSGSGFSFYSFENPTDVGDAGIIRNGFIGNITLPKSGEKPVQVSVTMTLTHRDYDLSVQKTLTLTLNPVDYEELMVEVNRKAELMELVKENFFDILNSNPSKIGNDQSEKNSSADQIKFDLSSFKEVRFKNPDDPTDNTLEYIYDSSQVVGDGVELSALPDWQNQEAWRLLKSSNPRYLTHENLIVTEPQYNTDVTIDAMLNIPSMEQYKDYFPEGASTDDANKLSSLFNQPITQNITILGKDGEAPDDYKDTIQATLIVEGSKILQDKSEHATAHQEWLNQTLEITRDTAFIDFLNDTLNADENLEKLELDINSGWLNTIDFKGFEANTTGQTNGSASTWMWYVKHKDSQDFEFISTLDRKDAEAYLQDGDTLKLKFINDPRYPSNVQAQQPENPIDLKDDADINGWTGFRGDAENQTPVREVESVPSITKAENWSFINDNYNEWGFPTSISDLISINNQTIYATGNLLVKLDENGDELNRLTLAGDIEYFSRLAYGRGMVLIPLQGGAIQAVDPETMKSLWVVESLDSFEKWEPKEEGSSEWVQKFYGLQSLGSTYIDLTNGIAYIPITATGNLSSVAGVIRAIDLSTGEELWRYNNGDTGYYWGGITAIDQYLLIGNDEGKIEVINQNGNLVKTSESYGTSIRTTLTQQDGKIFFATNDGVFHSLKFNSTDLSFNEHQLVKFATSSTSTATIFEGKAYIGGIGGTGGWGAPGVFAVIDLTTMQIEFIADNLVGEVKSAPLVIYDQNDKIYAYFTANTEAGLLYVYHNGKVEISYRPSENEAQYTTATPIIDANGNIYYSTDQAIISLSATKDANLHDFALDFGIDSLIGEMDVTILSEAQLTKHSKFTITDVTDNIKMLYDEDIKSQLDNANYVSFRTGFEGEVEGNPDVSINLQILNSYLALQKGQGYKLYRLVGDKLIEQPLGKLRSTTSIQFNQKLKEKITYVLAAVNVSTTETDETNKPNETNKPSETDKTNKTEKPVETNKPKEEDIQNNKTDQKTTNESIDTKNVVKTGETVYLIPILTLVSLAVISIITKKKIKEEEKTK